MTIPLESLIATGTKVWLDSVDTVVVARNPCKPAATRSRDMRAGALLQPGAAADGS